jgi:hypothetical protein
LSVLTNEAGIHGGALGKKVSEQANVMRDQVSLYLDRARRAARAKTIGSVSDPNEVVKAIVRTLERIHKAVRYQGGCPAGPHCPLQG